MACNWYIGFTDRHKTREGYGRRVKKMHLGTEHRGAFSSNKKRPIEKPELKKYTFKISVDNGETGRQINPNRRYSCGVVSFCPVSLVYPYVYF